MVRSCRKAAPFYVLIKDDGHCQKNECHIPFVAAQITNHSQTLGKRLCLASPRKARFAPKFLFAHCIFATLLTTLLAGSIYCLFF